MVGHLPGVGKKANIQLRTLDQPALSNGQEVPKIKFDHLKKFEVLQWEEHW